MNDTPKIDERHEFESLAELIKDNLRWRSGTSGGSAGSASHDDRCSEWNGWTSSYEQAVELTNKGWRDGADRVDALRRELDSAVQALVAAKAADMTYDVDGDWVDIGRMVTGDPECCGSWDMQGDDRSDKVVKIVSNICVSGSVKHETIFARGAACLAAVDIIESLGRRVELWVGLGVQHAGRRIETHIMVKPASQPAELDRLAYVLCHASMLRRIAFAHMEINNHNPSCCYPGPVWSDDAIVLPELKTGTPPNRDGNIREVLKICELAGIIFNEEDVAGLVGKSL